ncbi:MAG: VIT1/CCC1 transporter family protein [Candidatus Magasanikbacteria bacterium]|nr:VIT1/CCC1 transporter family protein [Candidatus Magasanikbacteria bacterium]
MITRNLDEARSAFRHNDPEASRKAHESARAPEEHQGGHGQYLKSFVYGGLDGIVTTFAVVAGVAGANLSSRVVLILGVANLIADGISMAFGDYLGTKAENEYMAAERERELWEVRNYPEGEKKEMVELYMEKGIAEADAKMAVEALSKNEKAWVDIMMVEELGMVEDKASPVKNALVTFGSFTLFGAIPVLVYAVARFIPFFAARTFFTAFILTGITLFILGTLKVFFTRQSWYRAGTEMLLLGGFAAGAAYIVGILLGNLA